jgi:hypothetical protein
MQWTAPLMPFQREESPVNIAARAARWIAANWKNATFGWLAFVIASAALGQAVGGEGLFDPLTRTATIDGRARESTPPGKERWICNDWGLLFGRRPAAQA